MEKDGKTVLQFDLVLYDYTTFRSDYVAMFKNNYQLPLHKTSVKMKEQFLNPETTCI